MTDVCKLTILQYIQFLSTLQSEENDPHADASEVVSVLSWKINAFIIQYLQKNKSVSIVNAKQVLHNCEQSAASFFSLLSGDFLLN